MTETMTAGDLTPGDKFRLPTHPLWFTVTRVELSEEQLTLFPGSSARRDVTLTVRDETMDRAAPVTVSADMRVIVP